MRETERVAAERRACETRTTYIHTTGTYIHTNLYSAKNRENESEALITGIYITPTHLQH